MSGPPRRLSELDTGTQRWRQWGDSWHPDWKAASTAARYAKREGYATRIIHDVWSKTMWGTYRRDKWRVIRYRLVAIKVRGVWRRVLTHPTTEATLRREGRPGLRAFFQTYHPGSERVRVRGATYVLEPLGSRWD